MHECVPYPQVACQCASYPPVVYECAPYPPVVCECATHSVKPPCVDKCVPDIEKSPSVDDSDELPPLPPVDEPVPHPVTNQLDVDIGINSNPPWGVAITLGSQHCLVMLGTTVIIPTIIVPYMGGGNVEKAQLIQTFMFVSGLNTLLQTWFGTRLPVVIRGSFRFIIPCLYVASAQKYYLYHASPHERFLRTMRVTQGALMVASILPMLLGFLGIWRTVVRFLTPLSAMPVVALVGLGLHEQGFPLLAQCVEIGLPELIIFIVLSQYLPHICSYKGPLYSRFAVLLSVGFVWAYASLLTVAGAYKNKPLNTQLSCRVDRSGLVSGASWFRLPYPIQWGQPKIEVGDVFVMLAAAFVAMVESTGSYIAAARYGGATHPPASVLSRGIGWLGFAIFLDGLFGTGVGSTVSVENVGLLAQTRVGSRRVIQISAAFMILFSAFGKFGAIVASVPLPIVGGLYCVLFPYTSSAGFGLLQNCNLNSLRTKFIIGFSFFMGISVPRYFREYVITSGHGPVNTNSVSFNNLMQVIFTSPATVAGIISYFVDLTLARKHCSTRKDSGRHWWAKFMNFDEDPRSAEFYSLPFGLSDYFPSF